MKPNKLNSIGVIFSDIISLEQIEKIKYNEMELQYTKSNHSENILLINTTDININTNGDFIFNIYEKNFTEPLNYTLEIIDKTGSESDILFNHHINIKSKNGYTFIIISVNDDIMSMNYTINDISNEDNPLIKFWTNTFVLITSIDDGNIKFQYYNNEKFNNIDKIIYVVNDITKFIPENLNKCQINYCSLSESIKYIIEKNKCFKDFKLNPINYEIDKTYTQLYYALYSLKNNESKVINLSSSYIAEIDESESDNNYILQVLRKDKIDDEPVIIFQKDIILSNFNYEKNSINYIFDDNIEKVNINFTSLCYIKEKLSLGDSILYDDCYNKDDKKECSFILGVNSEIKYDFKYDIYNLDSITIDKEFNYSVNVSSNKGKAKFEINISPPYSSINIKNISIIDSSNQDKIIVLLEENITFETNNCYIEIPVYKLAKKIRLNSIGLSNGKIYNVSDIYEYEFNTTRNIQPNYIYSFKGLDTSYVEIDSDFEYDYLSHKDSMITSPIIKNSTIPEILFGLDYYVNFYDDVILHTIRYELENQCQSDINKNNIKFKIFSENEYPDIQNVDIKLYNSETNKEFIETIKYANSTIEDGLNVSIFIINTESLDIGNYYVMFVNNNFSNYSLSIKKAKRINNLLGDIFTNKDNQYFILKFDDNFNENDLINIIYVSNDENKYEAKCDLMLDNQNSILCKIEAKISKRENYTLKYMDQCGQLINDNNIYLEVKENTNPIPIANNIKYDINSPTQLNIQFTSNLNITIISSIKLIKTDSFDSKEINIDIPQLNEEVNTINITIPSDIELGNYIIKFTYLNNYIIIIPKVIIYDSQFKIKDTIPYIAIDTFYLNNVNILFERNYHHNQIRKVY